MEKKLIILLVVQIYCSACNQSNNQKKPESSEVFTIKSRTLNQEEKSFIGKWSTTFRDSYGNLVLPKQSSGSYLGIYARR